MALSGHISTPPQNHLVSSDQMSPEDDENDEEGAWTGS